MKATECLKYRDSKCLVLSNCEGCSYSEIKRTHPFQTYITEGIWLQKTKKPRLGDGNSRCRRE